MVITLRLRNLEDGQLLLGDFESVEQARSWLVDRPENMEVVGVATAIDEDVAASLRASMRALDPEERRRADAFDEARLQHLRDEITRAQAAFETEAAAARAAMVDGDPDRPMTVEYDRLTGLRLADPDPREIPPVVRDAVLAWVAERNTWVHARRSRVARATVTVWPGPVPGGDEADRCQAGGQFEVEPGLD